MTPRHVLHSFFRTTWNESRRRGGYFAQDRLVDTLLAASELERVVISDTPQLAATIVRDRVLGRDVAFPAGGGRHHARIPAISRLDPTRPALVRGAYRAYGTYLQARARRAGLVDPAVITHNPFLAGHTRWDPDWPVTLYLTDDYSAAPTLERWHPAFAQAWIELRRHRIGVAAVSSQILERLQPTGPACVLPNGIEPEEWRVPPPPPSWVGDLPRPLLVYTGGLDDRIDPIAVRSAARAVPGATIVLVGLPIDPAHIATLRQIDGVVVRPPVGREELAALVFAADACLVPHRATPLTAAMSPIKLYEFLAAGRPVAGIDLPPMRGLGDRVVLAADAQAFGDAVKAALALPPQPEPDRLRFLDANSWAARHQTLMRFAADR